MGIILLAAGIGLIVAKVHWAVALGVFIMLWANNVDNAGGR